MNVREIGEVNLISAIKQMTERPKDVGVLGIGDDAASLLQADGKYQLLTTDISIEGIHFDLSYFSLFQVGWKSMASNLSDIAAMGGTPRYALVALGIPKSYSGEKIAELYKGMTTLADMFNTEIIGGDTSSADKLIVSITLIGFTTADRKPLLRSGAGHQDILCVTGNVGKSLAGLKILQEFKKRNMASSNVPAFMRKQENWDEIMDAHRQPLPRLKELNALLAHVAPTAMIDVSDGLASEIHHLCLASEVGVLLHQNRIPIHPDVFRVAEIKGEDPHDLALNSGEEFELLFTLPRSTVELGCDAVRMATGTEVHIIGEMKPKADGIKIRDENGTKSSLRANGFDHFS